MPVETGLARIVRDWPASLRGARVGLILHPASVLADWRRADAVLGALPHCRLTALFGPQHGVYGEKQDDMVESESLEGTSTRLPVHSLYGEVRQPTPEMLHGLDAVLFDLQDVGVRVYTFIWTMLLAMEACRDAGVRFVVLDRPNPIGGLREGPVLRDGFRSFVGLQPLPLRHGLTTGEVARLANAEFGIGCDLEVIPCRGWSRDQWFDETGLPFVFPSPNLPTLDSCTVFPGGVLIEGTNLSEGRGTTRPFELIGAPYLDAEAVAGALAPSALPGVVFRACHFEPTFQKHAGRQCGGVQLHVTDRDVFRPVRTIITLLATVSRLAPDGFRWREPPYEYEYEKKPIDVLYGGDRLRLGIDRGESPEEILSGVDEELREFDQLIEPYLLY